MERVEFGVTTVAVGVVVPDLDACERRLAAVAPNLEGTEFRFERNGSYLTTRCPWGNEIRVHGPEERFGPITLGIPYVEFTVPAGYFAKRTGDSDSEQSILYLGPPKQDTFDLNLPKLQTSHINLRASAHRPLPLFRIQQ